MHTIEIPERNKSVEIPSCWEELSNEQFAFIMQLFVEFATDNKDSFQFKVIVTYYLLGLYPDSAYKKGKLIAKIKEDEKALTLQQREAKYANLFQISELIGFLFDKKTNILHVNSVHNFIPVLENGFRGPADALTDCTSDEYFTAFDYFRNYDNTKSVFDLNMFMACLYWPQRDDLETLKNAADFDGRERNHFNQNLIIKHANEIQNNVPHWQKLAIFQFFAACDLNIKKGSINMNGKNVCFAPIFVNNEKNKTNDETTESPSASILLSISEGKVFGDIEKVEKQNIYTIFYYLLKKKQEADEIERKRKKS